MKRAGKFWVPDCEEVQLEQLRGGGWQLDHLDKALAHVTRRGMAIDGGAHVGSWTFHMLEKGFEVLEAFEPSPETWECLAENAKEWCEIHIADVQKQYLHLHKCGLGAEPGKMGMKDDTKYDGGNTGGRHLKGDGDVTVRPLDIFRFDDVSFIKLDVEGFEPFAIQGAQQTIARCRPVIMFEDKWRMAHRYGYQPGEAGRMLEALGMHEVEKVGSDRIFAWE